ncbi:MAG: hypothetical protein IJ848_00755 [Alphaproteobacteria bacterium]|nr:hypothetical protein [Alphaproteobacteria bacterium]
MGNFKTLSITLCAVLCLYTCHASEACNTIVNSCSDHNINVLNNQIFNSNVPIFQADNIPSNIGNDYPIFKYFNDNQVINKIYTIEELYNMQEMLYNSVIKYNFSLKNNTNENIINAFKNINDFIANNLLAEKRNIIMRSWNAINNMIVQNK